MKSVKKVPTPKQLIMELVKNIKALKRKGLSVDDTMKCPKIKRIQKLYSTTSGYILNDYQLKRNIKFHFQKKVKTN